MRLKFWLAATALVACALTGPVRAGTFDFSTGDPDGKIAIASKGPGSLTEAADDFVTTAPTTNITSATFTGLITGASPNIGEVNIDLYHVFPTDSDVGRTSGPPTFSTPQVPTRVNSPADSEFDGRNSTQGNMKVTPVIINSSFTAANSVPIGGIHPLPTQTTGGGGQVTGQEVRFAVNFTTPFSLSAGHYFFVPTVQVTGGDFFWLSAPRPIVPPGTPFPSGFTDLQAWTRDKALDPDWLRVGTDIVGGSSAPTFNAAFILNGQAIPEPSSVILLGLGVLGLFGAVGLRRRQTAI